VQRLRIFEDKGGEEIRAFTRSGKPLQSDLVSRGGGGVSNEKGLGRKFNWVFSTNGKQLRENDKRYNSKGKRNSIWRE